MITGKCHCGAVSYEFRESPDFAVSCNCSICRQLGVHWIYGKRDTVTVNAPENGLISYSWGERHLKFRACKSGGVTTHYTPTDPKKHDKVVVNLKLADPEIAKDIRIRHFDGADTWAFLD